MLKARLLLKFINYEIKMPRVNDSPPMMAVLAVNMSSEAFVTAKSIAGTI